MYIVELCMNLNSIKRIVKRCFTMNIWATTIVNYRLIGLKAVFWQPVIVFGHLKTELSGKIEMREELKKKRGVIIIGSKHETYSAEAGKAQLTIKGKWKVGGRINIGVDCCIYVGDNAELTTGDSIYIARDSQIHCMDNVTIGDRILTGEIYILDSAGHIVNHNGTDSRFTEPIVIKNDVYVGFRTMVLKGCKIPPYTVIGSGAVCVKDYAKDNPEGHLLLVGVPAIVKEKNVTPNCG